MKRKSNGDLDRKVKVSDENLSALRYILKVELTKFADRSGKRGEGQVKVFVRMELPCTEIEWIQLGVRIKSLILDILSMRCPRDISK